MILGTHTKKPNWRSRAAATVLIVGASTLSAPLIQADAHPEEELAGKYETHTGTSVIKREYTKNGKNVSEHFEIIVDGNDVKAFKVGPLGQKTPIDVEDIEGADFEFKSFPKFPKPPSFPGVFKNSENLFVFDDDEFKWLESLKALGALQGLEDLKNLEHLDGANTYSWNWDGDDTSKIKMLVTESKLAAARSLLEDTEVLADETHEIAKAKRELEKARKALKAAERALKEAN